MRDFIMSESLSSPASSSYSTSPYGSPSPQVSQLVSDLATLSCTEMYNNDFDDGTYLEKTLIFVMR